MILVLTSALCVRRVLVFKRLVHSLVCSVSCHS